MKLTIVVPMYNEERFIRKMLDALIAALQDHEWEIEILVVDDGSTDNTKSIIHDIIEGKKNFTYLFKQNGGYVSARNFGYSKINNETKYIHFMDADDILAPNYYSTLIQLLDKNPKISAICSNHDLIDVNDQRIGDSHYSPFIISTRFGYKILQGQYFRIPFISIFCWSISNLRNDTAGYFWGFYFSYNRCVRTCS